MNGKCRYCSGDVINNVCTCCKKTLRESEIRIPKSMVVPPVKPQPVQPVTEVKPEVKAEPVRAVEPAVNSTVQAPAQTPVATNSKYAVDSMCSINGRPEHVMLDNGDIIPLLKLIELAKAGNITNMDKLESCPTIKADGFLKYKKILPNADDRTRKFAAYLGVTEIYVKEDKKSKDTYGDATARYGRLRDEEARLREEIGDASVAIMQEYGEIHDPVHYFKSRGSINSDCDDNTDFIKTKFSVKHIIEGFYKIEGHGYIREFNCQEQILPSAEDMNLIIKAFEACTSFRFCGTVVNEYKDPQYKTGIKTSDIAKIVNSIDNADIELRCVVDKHYSLCKFLSLREGDSRQSVGGRYGKVASRGSLGIGANTVMLLPFNDGKLYIVHSCSIFFPADMYEYCMRAGIKRIIVHDRLYTNYVERIDSHTLRSMMGLTTVPFKRSVPKDILAKVVRLIECNEEADKLEEMASGEVALLAYTWDPAPEKTIYSLVRNNGLSGIVGDQNVYDGGSAAMDAIKKGKFKNISTEGKFLGRASDNIPILPDVSNEARSKLANRQYKILTGKKKDLQHNVYDGSIIICSDGAFESIVCGKQLVEHDIRLRSVLITRRCVSGWTDIIKQKIASNSLTKVEDLRTVSKNYEGVASYSDNRDFEGCDIYDTGIEISEVFPLITCRYGDILENNCKVLGDIYTYTQHHIHVKHDANGKWTIGMLGLEVSRYGSTRTFQFDEFT